eukprot:CAMPEP_0119325936 /NCGR_PEP_ID=MMETSP1333-20130426/67028_1 /TAXON_ID=418940 /ORGANISM="Scyphosphaera apsteinii, Strain RCC1455" /LENGTH=53 /DNA_ID=CAMNT_0007334089 /DNA_START=109 /DNA_END=267 /DNA_ORIENTATION=-
MGSCDAFGRRRRERKARWVHLLTYCAMHLLKLRTTLQHPSDVLADAEALRHAV